MSNNFGDMNLYLYGHTHIDWPSLEGQQVESNRPLRSNTSTRYCTLQQMIKGKKRPLIGGLLLVGGLAGSYCYWQHKKKNT